MLVGVGVVVGVLLSSAVFVWAGNLDSPNTPANTLSYNLEDIYNRLDSGAAGAQAAFTEPVAGPGATGHTLDEVMAKAPARDDANGATTGAVFNGRAFWGLTAGEWGTQSGTLDLACNTATFDGAANRVADAYDGAGNGANRWCMTDSGDAAADIANGKKAWVDGSEVTGTAAGGGRAAGVPKTGQTTSYATGDDGDLEKGVAWPVPRFADNGDGTVTDELTGLIWLQDGDCMGQRQWGAGADETFDVISQLNAGTDFTCDSYMAGTFNDWRLPSVRELYSLIHSGQADSSTWLNTQGFSGVQPGYYCSSTTVAANTANVWFPNLQNGGVYHNSKGFSGYVWPVRGGQ